MLENWSCIVLTCPTVSSVISTEQEINFLKKKGRISDDTCFLTVEDPGQNIGSGAATLNALLVATEHLSAVQNYMVVSSDVLNKARILILHNGRNFVYSCTGKAFISLPLEYSDVNFNQKILASGIISNLESLLLLIDKLSRNCPCGVWVCSTDMMILHKEESITVDWQNAADVVMFCIPSDINYATGHGVIAIDEKGYISDICYCGTEDQIKNLSQDGDDKVPLVSGIVYLSVNVAESLLSLHVQSPLDSCTYLGLDSGADPIQVSLFFDLLVAMCSKISKKSFIDGKCGKTYNLKAGISKSFTKKSIFARSLVWDELSREKYKMTPKILYGCQHLYWSSQDCAKNHMENLFRIAKSQKKHSLFQINSPLISSQSLIVNTLLKISSKCEIAPKSVIYDSIFEVGSLSIGENTFVCGVEVNNLVELNIPPNCVIINIFTKNPENRFILVFGANDNLMEVTNIRNGTFCNRTWEEHFKFLNITEDEIWSSDVDPQDRKLMNAKLFMPNLSLEDTLQQFQANSQNTKNVIADLKFKSSERYSVDQIMNLVNYSEVFASRRNVYAIVCTEIIKKVLINDEDISLLPYFHSACAEGWHFKVMDALDEVLFSDAGFVTKTRALSNMADLLGSMAGPKGRLRTGPGSNPAWNEGFALLKTGRITEGLQKLKAERSNWLKRHDHIMRAARHYERAAQILIQRSVNSVIQSVNIKSSPLIDIGTFIRVECPARIDLQGGWSDTPPICYELGGSVVNIAILVDGVKPIGANACRTKEPSIILKLGFDGTYDDIKIEHMKDILDYDQPNAQGALLKAAIVSADIVDVNSNVPLSEQLLSRFGGGFLIHLWSLLPHGSGMGTSSILAGAIISVLWTISGKLFDKLSVVHAVLYVEQLLTTGGGWQDQVSGILGGIQRGYSEAVLPLVVKTEPIILTTKIIDELNAHLLLIYTGKVRLAKNLLQNVIRNWYARDETVVTCFKNLILYSYQMKEALENGDFLKVGYLMNQYWEQKKVLAPGCEPLIVKTLMEQLKPICYGQLLVGAGGGGFMCILTKEPNAKASVRNVLMSIEGNQKMLIHTVTIDSCGLEII